MFHGTVSKRETTLVLAAMTALLALGTQPSWAGRFAENHPRRAQVLGRDANLNNRINNNYGNLGGHYGQLEHQDQRIQRQEQRDARQNGGYITPGEQAHLNKEENHLSNEIRADRGQSGFNGGAPGGGWNGGAPGGGFNGGAPGGGWNGGAPGGGFGGGGGNFAQNHPRRAEVLGRDNNLQNQINADRGNLNGQYGNLSREDQAIHQQEQADARYNGGYITRGEQRQLNREENHLNNQVRRDDTGNP